MLTIDRVSKRYSCLPSEALSRATTFDLKVANTAIEYENHCQRESQKSQEGYPVAPQMSQDTLKAALAKARSKK